VDWTSSESQRDPSPDAGARSRPEPEPRNEFVTTTPGPAYASLICHRRITGGCNPEGTLLVSTHIEPRDQACTQNELLQSL
jgi:hypothetical protein